MIKIDFLLPWSRNFNYTPHYTDNPVFLHLSFSLLSEAQKQKENKKRAKSISERSSKAKREQKGGCNKNRDYAVHNKQVIF